MTGKIRSRPVGAGGTFPPVPAWSQCGGDRFDFGIIVKHFLAHLVAPARLFVAAERQRRVEHIVAVDPHGAGADAAGELMVFCVGGETQIERVLSHAIRETRARKVNALVFVGDAMEEKVDRLCRLAGELGLLGVPIFIFHEGRDLTAAAVFKQIASLSRGAYLSFDLSSADRLKELLAAVAVYAAGGYRALTAYGEKKGGEILRLTAQLRD